MSGMSPPNRADYQDVMKYTALGKQREEKRTKSKKGGQSKKPKTNAARFKNFMRYYPLYKVLSKNKKYNPKLRETLVRQMENKHLRGLNEAVEGALDSKLELPQAHVKALKRTRNQLRDFKELKKDPLRQKNHLIKNQKGGFLPFLIPIITSVVSSAAGVGIDAISHAIKKKRRKR